MKLSRQAQLCVVGILQKGILGVADAGELLKTLDFRYEVGELVVNSPEQYQLSDAELEIMKLATKGSTLDA